MVVVRLVDATSARHPNREYDEAGLQLSSAAGAVDLGSCGHFRAGRGMRGAVIKPSLRASAEHLLKSILSGGPPLYFGRTGGQEVSLVRHHLSPHLSPKPISGQRRS